VANRKTVGTYWRTSTRERRAESKRLGKCLICFDALAHPDHPSMCRDCRDTKNAARKEKRANRP
jgi:hypothetical protein